MIPTDLEPIDHLTAEATPFASGVRVALAHHWLFGVRGGEKVLDQLCHLFPGAPVYTLTCRPEGVSETTRRHEIRPSLLNRLPGASSHYKSLLPLFPWAVRHLRVAPETEFLFSTDAAVIKGLAHSPEVPHVCYCHSPPRYLWDMHETYLRNTAGLGGLGRAVFRAIAPGLREFDRRSAQQVTRFVANSAFVQARIQEFYGRDSVVIHPPTDVEAFDPTLPREDFYLIVSELVPYKRIDLAVAAFNRLGKRLVIIGDGPEAKALRAAAAPNIEFIGRQPFAGVKSHFERCRGFLYPQVEDFGITAVEAQAAGGAVIAFRAGGALESVVEGRTGVFFDRQTPDSLVDAIRAFESLHIDPAACRDNAERFRPEHFREAIRALLRKEFPRIFPTGPAVSSR